MKSFVKSCTQDIRNERFNISIGIVIATVIVFCVGGFSEYLKTARTLTAKEVFSVHTALIGLQISSRIVLGFIILAGTFTLIMIAVVVAQELLKHTHKMFKKII